MSLSTLAAPGPGCLHAARKCTAAAPGVFVHQAHLHPAHQRSLPPHAPSPLRPPAVLDVRLFITAQHGGRHAFRICPGRNATHACFALPGHTLQRCAAGWAGGRAAAVGQPLACRAQPSRLPLPLPALSLLQRRRRGALLVGPPQRRPLACALGRPVRAGAAGGAGRRVLCVALPPAAAPAVRALRAAVGEASAWARRGCRLLACG